MALAAPLASLLGARDAQASAAPAGLAVIDGIRNSSSSGDSSSSSDDYDPNNGDEEDGKQNDQEDEDERARRRAAEDGLEVLRAKEQRLKNDLAGLEKEIAEIEAELEDTSDSFHRLGLRNNLSDIVHFHRPGLERTLREVQLAIALLERDL